MPKPPPGVGGDLGAHAPRASGSHPSHSKAAKGWAERQIAELAEARAYLETRGFSVTRADRESVIPKWYLSGWRWPLTSQQVIETARRARAQGTAHAQ